MEVLKQSKSLINQKPLIKHDSGRNSTLMNSNSASCLQKPKKVSKAKSSRAGSKTSHTLKYLN